MAVPKKKVSTSRRRRRINSLKRIMNNYVLCNLCSEYIKKHRQSLCSKCTSFSKNSSTNIVNYYNN